MIVSHCAALFSSNRMTPRSTQCCMHPSRCIALSTLLWTVVRFNRSAFAIVHRRRQTVNVVESTNGESKQR